MLVVEPTLPYKLLYYISTLHDHTCMFSFLFSSLVTLLFSFIIYLSTNISTTITLLLGTKDNYRHSLVKGNEGQKDHSRVGSLWDRYFLLRN
jgi:hypothetical protein